MVAPDWRAHYTRARGSALCLSRACHVKIPSPDPILDHRLHHRAEELVRVLLDRDAKQQWPGVGRLLRYQLDQSAGVGLEGVVVAPAEQDARAVADTRRVQRVVRARRNL